MFIITGHKSSGKTSYINKFITNDTIITTYIYNTKVYENVEIFENMRSILIEIPEDIFMKKDIDNFLYESDLNITFKDCTGILIFQDIRKKLYKSDLSNLYNILKMKNPYIKICIVGNKTDLVDLETHIHNLNIIRSIATDNIYCNISVLNDVNIILPFKKLF